MPKLVARNLDLEHFEQLRSFGPNAGLLQKPVELAGGINGAAGSAPDTLEVTYTCSVTFIAAPKDRARRAYF
jgi:hypothetical protein